ncbi:MAG: hypothetical protein ABSG33_01720 [Candidatus Bathyarchaeia archaeon]|jgi:seryl-tRNA synthetase
MANDSPSRDDTLEALDFIVNVLKEHEKDLDKLIKELSVVTEKIGETGKLGGRMEKIEEKINNLQKEMASLISILSSAPKAAVPAEAKERTGETAAASAIQGPAVVLRCARWEDFQSLAFGAQTVTFSFKEDEKVFQANALKNNQIVTYTGCLPEFSSILKAWLAEQLAVPEKRILEGALTLR